MATHYHRKYPSFWSVKEAVFAIGSLDEYFCGHPLSGLVVLVGLLVDVVDAEQVVDEVEQLLVAHLLQLSIHFVVFSETYSEQAAFVESPRVLSVILRLVALLQPFDIRLGLFEELLFSQGFACKCEFLQCLVLVAQKYLAIYYDVKILQSIAFIINMLIGLVDSQFAHTEKDAASELVDLPEEGVDLANFLIRVDVELQRKFLLALFGLLLLEFDC